MTFSAFSKPFAALFGGGRAEESLSDVILSFSPVAYWKLDETSGATAINYGSLGAGADGTYSGPTLAQIAAPGGGLAPYFDGANDYCATSTVALRAWYAATGHLEGTMLFWAKAFNIGVFGDGLTHAPYAFSNGSGLYLYAGQIYIDGRFRYVPPQSWHTAPNTNWNLFTIAWSSSGNTILQYYNGATQVYSGVYPAANIPATLATNWARIGVMFDTANDYYGYIAHVAIFPTALTPANIAAIYAAGI